MNENRVSIFRCFVYSITGFDKYKLLVRQSMGKAVGYLILLTLLLSVAVFVPIYKISNEIYDKASVYITENMPDFSISDGQLEVYGQMPIVIESGNYPIVIDTTSGAEDRILNQYDSVLLFTSDKMIMKDFINRQEYPLSAFEGLEITKDVMVGAMPMMRTYMTIILVFMGIFIGIFFVIGKFIAALVVSLIGLIANSSLKTNLTYNSIFKISIYSMTLPLIIGTVINALTLNIPFLSVLFYIGSGVYVFGAISSIKKELEASGGDGRGFENFNYGSGNPANTPGESTGEHNESDNSDEK